MEMKLKSANMRRTPHLSLMALKKCFTATLYDLELISTISGLTLNNKKTKVLWIGSCTGREDQLSPKKNLKWFKDKVRALGVWISPNSTISMNKNYSEKLEKIRSCLSCWEYRRLSLLGKIVVLRSLIASQLVYILSPLPTNQQVLDEINNIFYNFFGTGRGTKSKEPL